MTRSRIFQVSSVLGLSAAVALLVMLGAQNRTLKQQYADLVERTTEPYPGLLVPMFEATTLEGDLVTIGQAPADGWQVLFFFTTTCPYCRATLPAWNRIAAQVSRRGGIGVYGIQLDSAYRAREYIEEHGVSFPVVTLPPGNLAQRLVAWYRIRGVPLTLVVDEDGRVGFVRVGEITAPEALDSVLAAVAADSAVQEQVGSALP
jgi:peroxiredoxin